MSQPAFNNTKFEENTYVEQLNELLNQHIDNEIERHQKSYAIEKMNIDRHWINDKYWKKLRAVVATAQCGSTDELEELILNTFDFEEIVIKQ